MLSDWPDSGYRLLLTHVCIVAVFVAARVAKWAVFGTLSPQEASVLKNTAAYTVGEFLLGLHVLQTSRVPLDVVAEARKYAALFACLVLVKFFRHLTADRVHTTYCGPPAGRSVYVRLALGLVLLNMVDALLIARFLADAWRRGNALVALFGHEVLTHYPATLSTSLQFTLNAYEAAREPGRGWAHRRRRIVFVAEFCLHMLRLAMLCVFAGVFLHHYTFPLHMVPSLYASLRVAVAKTRGLVDLRKRELMLAKLRVPAALAGACIICYEAHGPESRSIAACRHTFHYECLQLWLEQLPSCPVCRGAL